ncbi:hypothetical protein PSN45_002000 [Yamadazyma tenuis]|uniref:UPF0005-domain-containing protein n=1 Tax=Candida tenuis (strain ATCC 10573 / BCRC 21748 / CBS 615 / JCM 9827 / NBRC 10315 / NRRL Y-1498 / VKM Y-70) TaxID=590646 RepID=G3BD60_CANTC|nr:UPF0005-domain-containing protein [Yamadazyma tenuis ATCC 10573]EGV60247.1 UPF0005-domain-containing protein [Yamadazyma tenuis ATCC 10573]WEJ94511.1 hypothetical protein PSN45_002000 [Yamadazyma tenuis]
MSYQPVENQPPPYGNPEPRVDGDNIPDDFKYSVNVASCELPIRQMFIRKVYALLSVQLVMTLVVGLIIKSNSAIQSWCLNNMWLFIVSVVGALGFGIGTHVMARSYPTNLILLSGFTLCESYGIGLTCSMVKSDVVLQAVMLTFVIFVGLTLFAFQTKYDFTSWQGALSMGLWFLIGWGFIMIFFPQSKMANLIYSGIGALVFCVYIIVDTQNIMKTCHLDDEIPATMMLYLDILNLFLFILRILDSRSND